MRGETVGRGARETLTRRQGVIQRRETAACVQERRGLHGKTPEKGTSPGEKQSGRKGQKLFLFYRHTHYLAHLLSPLLLLR